MAAVMILHRLVSGKCFLQSGLRVLELLVKMDIVYEDKDKDKIILNMPVAGDGKKVWWKYGSPGS